MRFTGSGNGYNTPTLVTLPGGTFTGAASHTIFTPGTRVVVDLAPGGSGSFAGSPLAGPMPLRGVLRFKSPGGTVAAVPLNSGYDLAAFGVGGSVRTPVSDQTVRARFRPWSAGMATPPRGLVAVHGNVNTRYSGSDARTPEGRGQITLVSPAKISFGTESAVLLGTLQVNFVPEPGAPFLLGTGAALLLAIGARRRGAKARAA